MRMRRYYLPSLLIVWSLSLCGIQPGVAQSQSAAGKPQPQEFNRALKLAQQGKVKEAIQSFRQIVHRHPNSSPAHFNLAMLYRQQAQNKKAEYHFKHAWALEPTRPQALAEVVRITLEDGRVKEAEAHLNTLKSHFPKFPELSLLTGSVAAAKQDWKTAYEQFRQASKIMPNDVRVTYNMGLAAYQLGKFEEAQLAFQRSTQLSPKYTTAWKALGMTYESMNKPEKAIAAYTEVLKQQPDDLPTRLKRGVLYQQINKPEKALVDYQAILKTYPRNVDANLRAGSLSFDLKRYEDAKRYYGQAFIQFQDKSEPLYWGILTEIALCEYHLKQYANARKHFAEVIRYNPKTLRAFEGQALALEATVGDEELVPFYREWARNFPDDVRPLLKIAELYAKNNQYDAADAEYRQMLSKFDESTGVRQKYAEFLKLRGKYEESLQQYDTVLGHNPDNTNALVGKANLLERMQRWDDARVIYEILRNKNSNNEGVALSVAAMYDKAGRFEEAVREYRALVFRKPPVELAIGALLDLYARHKNVDEAANFLRECIKTIDERYLTQLALLLAQSGRLEEAVQEYEKAIARKPKEKSLHMELGYLLKQAERYESALRHLHEVGKLDPKDTWSRLHIADILLKQDKKQAAWEVLTEAVKINPDDVALYAMLEKIAVDLGRTEEYETLLKSLAQHDTQGQEAVKRYITWLEMKQRSGEAVTFLRTRLRARPDDPTLLRLQIETLEKSNKFREALPYYFRLSQQKPPDLFMIRQWAIRSEEHGTAAESVRAYETLVKLIPGDVSSALKLAQYYRKAGQNGKAIDLVRTLAEDYPDNDDVKRVLSEMERTP